jgi:hypothetical protein
VLSIILSLAIAADPAQSLVTIAEQSKWTRTGRYDEVQRLCADFAKAYPDKVKCETFGTTPEGRPMLMLTVADKTPPNAPVILIQGGIHAGEIDGKDAGFWALREILENKAAPGALKKLTLIFVPVFNVDGHERFGANQRPNQRGPEEMGWRTTSQNLNLNRDYAKADAPEMGAMLRLLRDKDPIAYMDLHVTDGSKFEHDIAILVEPVDVGPPGLRELGKKMREALLKKMESQKHLPLPFYPSFNADDDPASGFSTGPTPARFAGGYWATVNRISILVETHSWKNYEARVKATRDVFVDFLELAARDAGEWVKAARAADEQMKKLGGTNVPLEWGQTEKFRTIDFRGYEYVRSPSAISGGMKIEYDETKPKIWRVPLYEELKVTLSVRAPKAGYLVPPAHASWVGQKLRDHGIESVVVDKARPGAALELFRASEVVLGQRSFEGRTSATVKGAWSAAKRDIAAGSLFVPIAQRRARLVLQLFEPLARDSFVSWGFFNAAFEQKEYMEAYVVEEVAKEMLARDPALRAEFEKKLATEPTFQQSAQKRLDFFYRRHPSYDAQLNVVPIYRVDTF